jgi:hypothetical protein
MPDRLCSVPSLTLIATLAVRRAVLNAVIALSCVCGVTGAWANESDSVQQILQPAFRQHCASCHGAGDELEGDVDLDVLRDAASLIADPALTRDLIDVLDAGLMPPEQAPPLGDELRQEMVVQLEHLYELAGRKPREFPPTPIRRMNRFQYNNAVEDLFQLKVEVFALPERMLRDYGYFRPDSGKMPDTLRAGSRPLGKSQLIGKRLAGVAPFPQDLRAEHGFDNRGDHLSLSPLLMESFLKLGRSIVQSDDFNSHTCGIWDSFFAPPPRGAELDEIIQQRLRGFLTRAFRRPVDGTLLGRYAAHVQQQLQHGVSFTAAMRSAASAALSSPRFLYLYDRAGDADQSTRLDDFELASRLSFFLWASIPDAQLLELADSGRLHDKVVLAEQVERMLRDEKLKRFCDSFPAQWMQLERIISSVPDPQLYPEFYFAKFRVSMHMMLEPLLLFEAIMVENRSILELIDSDFSYRSELLENWYRNGTQGQKLPPTAIPFQRVTLADRRQGGVITTAAVMTMTSGATRTQPITRGAWIASVIFNDPPEPPPADVPPLPESEPEQTGPLTLRERLAAHRDRAGCVGCHAKIDPLGFVLENYGPTGVWRDVDENGVRVDPHGVLFGRHEFADVVEFKEAVLVERDRFTLAFAEHLLSYALSREIAPADWPALDEIAQRTAHADYRIRVLVREIVLSEPFLHKTSHKESQ